jgi:hypothetical protein
MTIKKPMTPGFDDPRKPPKFPGGPQPEVEKGLEPPRIWWRLQFLRKWSYEQVEQIFC